MPRPNAGAMGSVKGPRKDPIPILISILVAIIILTSAMFWTEQETGQDATVGLHPLTLEGWLYDYYYNATDMGYDRDEWGGKVIWTEDPASLVNPDPDNLTVPVFVYIPLELTAGNIDAIIGRFFPGVNTSSLYIRPRLSEDGTVVSVGVSDGNKGLTIHRDGLIEYREDYLPIHVDVFRTNESAKEHAIEWLKAHDIWPSDIESISARLYPTWGDNDAIVYLVEASRRDLVPGFDFAPGRLTLCFEANTGKVFDLDLNWPDIDVPFVVTDLPPVDLTLERFGLSEASKTDPKFHVSGFLEYGQARVIRDRGLSDTAPIYFYIPYRFIGSSEPFGTSGEYGVIFPEEHLNNFRIFSPLESQGI